jgi:hypothetical protein
VCNPITNRWVKRTGKIGKNIPATATAAVAQVVAQAQAQAQVQAQIQALAVAPAVAPVAPKPKPKAQPKKKTLSKPKPKQTTTGKPKQSKPAPKKPKQAPKPKSPTLCKQMEEKCAMDTGMLGEEWCSIKPANRLVSFDNFKFCTTLDEFYLTIESALNNGVSGRTPEGFHYSNSQPTIPREPFRREMIPEKMVEAVYKKMKELKRYPKTPATQYFMKHYKEFYRTIGDPYKRHEDEVKNKFTVRKRIAEFLGDHSKPYYLTGFHNVQNNKTMWRWNKPIHYLNTFF